MKFNRNLAIVSALLLIVAISAGVYATSTTLNLRVGGTGVLAGGDGNVTILTREVSFADDALEADSVVQLFNVPADTYVVGLQVQVTTAEGATCTIDVGDSAGVTTYNSNTNFNTTTNAFYTLSGVGKYYTSADVISLNLDHATDAAEATFRLVAIQL